MLIKVFSNMKGSITEDKPLLCIQKSKASSVPRSGKKLLSFQAVTPLVPAHFFQRSSHWSSDSSYSLAVKYIWNESSNHVRHLHATKLLSPSQHVPLTKRVIKISVAIYRNDSSQILLLTHQTIYVGEGSTYCKWGSKRTRPVHRY
jgi:hypothetical protein